MKKALSANQSPLESFQIMAERLERVERMAEGWNLRLQRIVDSKKHYLRRRLATRSKHDQMRKTLLRQMAGLRDLLGQQHFYVRRQRHGRRAHVVLLNTAEYAKLMLMLKSGRRG